MTSQFLSTLNNAPVNGATVIIINMFVSEKWVFDYLSVSSYLLSLLFVLVLPDISGNANGKLIMSHQNESLKMIQS